MLQFETAMPEDAEMLAGVSERAFHSDVNCGAPKEQGPPGYNSAEWQVSMMNDRRVMYYKILSDDIIIGGFLIFNRGGACYELARIFIDPDFQNQNIGTKTFEFLWEEFSEAKKWTLGTPAWNQRTRHFYEKVGFKVKKIEGDEVTFEKIVE